MFAASFFPGNPYLQPHELQKFRDKCLSLSKSAHFFFFFLLFLLITFDFFIVVRYTYCEVSHFNYF